MNPAMNQIEEWRRNRVILVQMSEIAQNEASVSGNESRTEKALGYVHTKTIATTEEEVNLLALIKGILFPIEHLSCNQQHDIEIVFNAKKYNAILVTLDGGSKSQPGGILGHKKELSEIGVTVMSDVEAVNEIRKLIRARDVIITNYCAKTGLPVPEWVGVD